MPALRAARHGRLAGLAVTGLAVLAPWPALAHGERPQVAWNGDVWMVGSLILAALLYGRGVWVLWAATAPGRGVRRWQAVSFAGGWLVLAVALVSPLHGLSAELFAAHMVQHTLLMLLAAPLLVLGRPLLPGLWALPRTWRRRLGRVGRVTWVRATWRALTTPLLAWAAHAVVLWIWHVPGMFQAALASEPVHAVQHLSFLGSALAFWWALIHHRQKRTGYGAAVLAVFTTAMHSGLLGALLTFARTPWYPKYATTANVWGLTPLEDQQLAGLIMWVPAGMLYVLAGLLFCAAWLRESERQVRQRAGQAVPNGEW